MMHPGAMTMTRGIRRAQRYQQRLRDRIAQTAALPPSPERDALLQRERLRYVTSGGVKAAHLRRMKRHRGKSDVAIASMADRINLLTAPTQTVPWWPKQKRSGGVRRICDPPTKPRLGQLVAKDLIVAQIRPEPHAYDWPGRGVHRCVTDIRNTLQSVGPHACLIDLEDCYQRVEIDNLYRMNLLPTELIQSSIDVRHLSFRRGHCHRVDEHIVTDMCSADPQGLMQGGPASSAIVVALLGDVSRGISAPVWVGHYVDDFIIVGAEREIVTGAAEELARYLTECPLGPSECKPPRHVDARDGFRFLGCLLWQSGDEVETCIPPERFDSIRDKMVTNIRNPSGGDEHRNVDHFVRKALAPYPWAPPWQRELIMEAAEGAYDQQVRSRRTSR